MKKIIPSYIRVPLIFAIVFAALEFFIDSGDRPAFIKFPMVSLFLLVFLFLLIAIEVVVNAVDKVTYHLLTDDQKKQLDDAQSLPFTEGKFYQGIMSKLTRSKAVEQEADVMLDHDYDGIRELDNVLPPWWVYLFYATIVFAAVYLIRFHVMGDYTQAQEFDKEVELANIEIAKNAAASPDDMNIDKVTLLTDAESIAKGKEIFTNTCAACHKPDGGGSVGPNLTDEFWINGGGIKNVFKVITDGSPNNPSMVAWKNTLKPTDIQKIASYVLSLQGSKPAGGKAAEGEKWVEDAAPKADAAVTATDSTKTAEVPAK
ncbi:MAG: c-type cytochrome [Flavobacterium sp.]|uniref:cbb3-type cytochrome c oxidase N-terminal domain-containing protein n=1 Tax=Flavobacterium sp. TaxID=239 RepID=UPI0022BCC7A9|nr:cbb3-type cytochrome c oxidase N-terminal domain-containing protein [Flavobacterium sp.]MCZ8196478.1 c-type cytochrome [Flavobacterium sp.]